MSSMLSSLFRMATSPPACTSPAAAAPVEPSSEPPFVYYGEPVWLTVPAPASTRSSRESDTIVLRATKELEVFTEKWYCKLTDPGRDLKHHEALKAIVVFDLFFRPSGASDTVARFGDVVGVRCVAIEGKDASVRSWAEGRLLASTMTGYLHFAQKRAKASLGDSFQGNNCFTLRPEGGGRQGELDNRVLFGDQMRLQSRQYRSSFCVLSGQYLKLQAHDNPATFKKSLIAVCPVPAALLASLPPRPKRVATSRPYHQHQQREPQYQAQEPTAPPPPYSEFDTTSSNSASSASSSSTQGRRQTEGISSVGQLLAAAAVTAAAPSLLNAMDRRYSQKPDVLRQDIRASGVLHPDNFDSPKDSFVAEAAVHAAPHVQQAASRRYKERPELMARDADKVARAGAAVATNKHVQRFAKNLMSAAFSAAVAGASAGSSASSKTSRSS